MPLKVDSQRVHIFKVKGSQILTHCSFASKAPRTFVTFHLMLPMPHKNSSKEMGEDIVFGVRGFIVR
jgi:hypothetical protein